MEGSSARFLAKREELARLLQSLTDASFNDINIRDSTLEDIFLEYYGEETAGKVGTNKKKDESSFEPRKAKRRGWFK